MADPTDRLGQIFEAEAKAALEVARKQQSALDQKIAREQQMHQVEAQAALQVARQQQSVLEQQAQAQRQREAKEQQLLELEARSVLEVARKKQDAIDKEADAANARNQQRAAREQQVLEVEAKAALEVARKQKERQDRLEKESPLGQAKAGVEAERKRIEVDNIRFRMEQAGGGPPTSLRERAKEEQKNRKEAEREASRKHEKELADRQRKAEQSHTERQAGLREILKGNVASGVGQLGGEGVGTMLATVQGLDRALQAAAAAAKLSGDAYRTNAEKITAFSESLPIIGGMLKSTREIGEGLTGADSILKGVMRGMEDFRAAMEVTTQHQARVRGAQLEARGHEALGAFIGGLGGPEAPTSTARGTVSEEREYREMRQRQPAADAIRMAEARLFAAKSAAAGPGSIDDRLAKNEQRLALAKMRHTGHIKTYNSLLDRDAKLGPREALEGAPARKVEYSGVIASVEKEALTIKAALAEKEDLIARKKAEGLKIAEAESAVRKGAIEMAKTDLAIAEQREAKATQQARSLGQMSQMDFMLGKQMLGMVAKRGVANVTPEMLSRARAVAPEIVDKLSEAPGEGRRKELRDFVKGLGVKGLEKGGDFEFGLEESRKKVDEKALAARALEMVDAEKIAKDTAKVMNEWGAKISAAIEDAIRAAIMEMDVRRMKGDRLG